MLIFLSQFLCDSLELAERSQNIQTGHVLPIGETWTPATCIIHGSSFYDWILHKQPYKDICVDQSLFLQTNRD